MRSTLLPVQNNSRKNVRHTFFDIVNLVVSNIQCTTCLGAKRIDHEIKAIAGSLAIGRVDLIARLYTEASMFIVAMSEVHAPNILNILHRLISLSTLQIALSFGLG